MNAGEVYGRVEHLSGFFLRGYAGGSELNSGKLKDEDFPPTISAYSSTNSDQHGGSLKYATIDFSWDWRTSGLRLGFFAGYLYYVEQLNPFGCTFCDPSRCAAFGEPPIIEEPSLMAVLRKVCRNVKRWPDARMALRWTGTAMLRKASAV